MSDPISKVAERLDAHYTQAATDAVPPAPRFRAPAVRPQPTPLGVGLLAAVVIGALLGAAWLGVAIGSQPSVLAGLDIRLPVQSPPATGEASPVPLSACPAQGTTGLQTLPAGCRIPFASPAMVVTTVAPSTLKIDANRVGFEHGWAVFEVEHRTGRPLVVGFDGGDVEVLGTTFSVFQDPERGHVELVEGKVRILETSGASQVLGPGGRFAWDRHERSSAEPGTDSRSLPPTAERPTPNRRDESIDTVAWLRSQKEYPRARALLRRLRVQASTSREREVLDYELGTILKAEQADAAAQCKHWDAFTARYPKTHYADAVRKQQSALQCAER